MTTPNRIRFWRQQKGWTLQQLAEAASTTRAQIDKLERGSRRLTVDWMLRLAQPLGCDPRSLMENTNNAAIPTATTVPLYKLAAQPRQPWSNRASKPTRQIPQPYFLANSPQAYGLILNHKSLEPMLQAGQTLFIHPQHPIKKNHLVIATTTDNKIYLGLFKTKNAQSLTLITPTRTLTLPTTNLASLHSIIAVVEAP